MQQGNEVKVLSGNAREEKEKEREDEGGWEFVPAKVPNGISLRNFGIQVVSLFSAGFFRFWSFFILVFSFFSVRSIFLIFGFGCLLFCSLWAWKFEVIRFHALEDPICFFFSFSLDQYPIKYGSQPRGLSFSLSCSYPFPLLAVVLSILFSFLWLMAYSCNRFRYVAFLFCSAPMRSGLSAAFLEEACGALLTLVVGD